MTRSFALLFPGQGSQEVGMGRELLSADEFTKTLAAKASEVVQKDLAALCLKGPDRILLETRYLQPALTCVCLGLWRRFQASGLIPAAVAGHSVGEMSALAACGAASPEDTALLAADRGLRMSEAAAERSGGMAAISGIDIETIERLLKVMTTEGGTLVIGAVNAPSQVSVSGDMNLIQAICTPGIVPKARITKLRVSGAWHSPHMDRAAVGFKKQLASIPLSSVTIPMVLNRDGREARNGDDLQAGIGGQLTRPVRWDQVMRRLCDMGIRDFVEIGPGKVLRGLVRLNDSNPEINVYNIYDLRSLDRAVSALNS